jgi:uncharacterized protein YebE (UPF0316 family)
MGTTVPTFDPIDTLTRMRLQSSQVLLSVRESSAGLVVNIGLDPVTLLLGMVVFLARVTDVTMGTMRTISIVQGRTKRAFILGFFEVSMWLVVISMVVQKILEKPILGVFYALGFSTGNVVGIMLEKRLGFGHMTLRIISAHRGREMADELRGVGYGVTIFSGEGLTGPVTLLYVVCRRKDLRYILPIVKKIDPDSFHITEQAGDVSRVCAPFVQQPTGWRAAFKKK